MEIMTRHCMGDRPVAFQVTSNQELNFTTGCTAACLHARLACWMGGHT